MRYQYLVIFILTILIFATSCTSIKESLGGNYFAKWGTDGFYYIHLDDSDSTFEYESNALHKGKYNGFWKISKDSIYLHFPKSNNPIHIITAHNLHNQVWRLKINKRSLYFPYLKIKYRKINEQRIIKWRNNSGKRHCACSAEGTLLKRTREAKIGTSSSFRDYSGSRIFENGLLEYSYFPGGYFDSAGAVHYTHTDYQGSIIAVTDSTGTVVQTVGYYPYGEPWREPSGQPMLFAGKERTPQADYHFDPRNYNAAGLFWHAPDRKAHDYTGISSYAFCAGNPIWNVDPTGMDIYHFDASGNLIETIKKTDYDQIALKKEDESILSEKYTYGTIVGIKTDIEIADNQKGTLIQVGNSADSEDIFTFLANNTDVEFSLLQCGTDREDGPNYISTTHSLDSDRYGTIMVKAQLKDQIPIRYHFHNHPSGYIGISPGDSKFVEQIHQNKGYEKVKFFMYVKCDNKHFGRIYQYDEKSEINRIIW